MAMPPDGSSPWSKQADLWVLMDGKETFASLSVHGDGATASVTMPFEGSPYDSFYVVRFAASPQGLQVRLDSEDKPTPWSEASSSALRRDVMPRKPFGLIEGAAPIATLVASGEGIELLDPHGRRRLIARRAGSPAVADADMLALADEIAFYVPSYDDTRIQKTASSLP